MLSEIVLTGASSKKKYFLKLRRIDYDCNLLGYLREKEFPIASSCSGEGVCKKCVVNKNQILSCSLTVGEYLKEHGNKISVSYL